MASTDAETDMGLGLGLVFGLVAVGATLLTTVNGYTYATRTAQGLEATGLQVSSGVAFGVAIVAAGLAIVAVHVFDG
jgi:hypothetical protein